MSIALWRGEATAPYRGFGRAGWPSPPSLLLSPKNKKLRAEPNRREVLGKIRYFVFLAYRFWNRSTRPAVSTNFCVPVKNGWHFEQMPMRMSLCVERVLMMLPHAQ